MFNLIYRDGKDGVTYAKRFHLGGFTRDKEYQLTMGTKGSRIFFFSVHDTEEESGALSVNVYLKNQFRRLRRPIPFDFGRLRVKSRTVMGNMVTKNPVERIARIMPAAAEGEEGAAEGENALPTSLEPQLPPPVAPETTAGAEVAVPAEPEVDFTQLDLFNPQNTEPDHDEH